MSGHATDGDQPSAVPIGTPPATGKASPSSDDAADGPANTTGAATSGAATSGAGSTEAATGAAGLADVVPAQANSGGTESAEVAGSGPDGPDAGGMGPGPGPGEAAPGESPAAGDAVTGGAIGEAAAANASAMTIVLDPELATDDLDSGEADDETDWPAPRFSKLAIVAFITSIVALIPLAVGFGIAALVGIHRSGRRGHGMAMSALFICAAWVIVAGAVGTVGVLTHGFKKPVTVKYHEAAIFKLREGECINIPNGQLVSVLPCSTPHEAEVFATFSLPASAWPGTAAVKQQASDGCVARLIGYINPQLGISLAQNYVFPTEVDWTAGTRTVICEVRATTGDLTGSVRGAS